MGSSLSEQAVPGSWPVSSPQPPARKIPAKKDLMHEVCWFRTMGGCVDCRPDASVPEMRAGASGMQTEILIAVSQVMGFQDSITSSSVMPICVSIFLQGVYISCVIVTIF